MARKPHVFVPQPTLQCCGKNVYRSQHEAEQVAEDQTLLTYGLLLTVYRCMCGCGGWHLTRTKAVSDNETN